MKFAVIDLETTGIDPYSDYIVEIGIVEVHFKDSNLTELFNSLVIEDGFDDHHKKAWIFRNGFLDFNKVLKARSLEEYRDEIQDILNEYWVTSYNESFDFLFLELRGFEIKLKLPCLMKTSAYILKFPYIKSEYRNPKFREVWDFFFPLVKIEHQHNALADAKNEAKVLLEMVKKHMFPKEGFSKILAKVYSTANTRTSEREPRRSGWEHFPKNEKEALAYLDLKFPLHIPKISEILNQYSALNSYVQNVLIFDIGCGPFTFTQAILNHYLKNYGSSRFKFKFTVVGVEISKDSLKIGRKMLYQWGDLLKNKNWKLNFLSYKDSILFSNFHVYFQNNINQKIKYNIYFGCSAVLSSISKEYPLIVDNIFNAINSIESFAKKSQIFLLFLEPKGYNLNLKVEDLNTKFPHFQTVSDVLQCAIIKPEKMNSNIPFICSEYAFIFSKSPSTKTLNFKKLNIFKNFTQFAIAMNKSLVYSNYMQFCDYLEFEIYKHNVKPAFKYFKNFLPEQDITYFKYRTRKGIFFSKSRHFFYIPMDFCILSVGILGTIGANIDFLFPSYLYGSRILKGLDLNFIYTPFSSLYLGFNRFEERYKRVAKKFCRADVKDYYPSIELHKLRDKFATLLKVYSYDMESSNKIIDLLGVNSLGLPIGHPLSPFFGNLYLRNVDEDLLRKDEIKYIARYMDDYKLIIIDDLFLKNNCYDFIKHKLSSENLDIKKSKFDYYNLSKTEIERNYYFELEKLTKLFKMVFVPLKNGIIFFLLNLKEKRQSSDYKVFLLNLVDILDELNIFIDFNRFYRFLKLAIFKINQDSSFFNHLKHEKLKLDLPSNPNLDIIELKKYIIEKNKDWLNEFKELSNLFLLELKKELNLWKDFLTIVESPTTESKALEKLKANMEDSIIFNLSLRKIRFIIYRLTIIKHPFLKKPKDTIVKKIKRFYKLQLPLKTIGYFLYRYNHITLLTKLIEDETQEFLYKYSGSMSPEFQMIYSNDKAQIIHLLGLYFEKNRQEFNLNSWKPKIIEKLNQSYPEVKLSILEFILRIDLTNKFEYSQWKKWFNESNEYFIKKSILLCLAHHHNSKFLIPFKIKRQIKKSIRYSKINFKLVKREWRKTRLNRSHLFENIDIFDNINFKEFLNYIDLDSEFDYAIEAEDKSTMVS